jgi:hypothetical protein
VIVPLASFPFLADGLLLALLVETPLAVACGGLSAFLAVPATEGAAIALDTGF